METASQAELTDTVLERMENALAKCAQLIERHLAAGELTVPARALYFILHDAGFGAHSQTQEVKQTPKEEQLTVNERHHHYGMRR
jgi:hypothetical protein